MGCVESYGAKSLRLRVGMTEPQLVEAVGYLPRSAEAVTCGTATPSPFHCRRLTWRTDGLGSLIVFTAPNAAGQYVTLAWHVNE